jgi:hypothetical protein
MIKLRERALFTLILSAFAGLILYFTVSLSPVARLVPITVVIPTLGLLIFQLVLDLAPWLEQKYRRFEKVDLLGVEEIKKEVSSHDQANSANAGNDASSGRRELDLFSWVLLLVTMIYLLGFLVALPVYLLLYLRWRSGESWALSISVAVGMGSVLYGVFILTLRLRLDEGHLWRWLGF